MAGSLGTKRTMFFGFPHFDIEGEPLTVVIQIDSEILQLICRTVF